jgi:hypothetical protein
MELEGTIHSKNRDPGWTLNGSGLGITSRRCPSWLKAFALAAVRIVPFTEENDLSRLILSGTSSVPELITWRQCQKGEDPTSGGILYLDIDHVSILINGASPPERIKVAFRIRDR